MFISHTSELEEFPQGKSYVAKVKDAISAAGHVIVEMVAFPAADEPTAHLCIEQVQGCDVYVGVLGTRYGSPVRDRPEVSYTELEFDTATEASLPRLVFMLNAEAEDVGIPPAKLIDREFGARQDAFRRRVRDSGLSKASFADPAELGQLVERALRGLAETRRRTASELALQQVSAKPQPVRASKFVNPPPAVPPTWFQDRQVETGLLAQYVTDPGIRMVTVCGRGGIGKTAMVCRLLKGLEAGHIPDVKGSLARITAGGIVYLCRNGLHKVEYPTLTADLLRLVPADAAQKLKLLYQDPRHPPQQIMLALLEAFPAGEPVVVLLDNLESVMDAEHGTLREQALQEALSAVLTAPAHAVTVIITTRVKPAELWKVEPSAHRELPLNHGLGRSEAETVLRALDEDGHLGLRDAPKKLLYGLREHTRGFPRALEAVKAILENGNGTITPEDLLDHTRHLPEDRVVQVLVGEAYDLLDVPAQQVMQALSVYPASVPAVGVDFLLQPVSPTIDSAPILARLAGRQLVRCQDRHYYLHRVDRDYARSQLPPGRPGDSTAAFTLTGLQARAAGYYAQIRTPPESWRTLDDVQPQLAEFELRCDTGDYDTAAAVLREIDFNYLRVWGHYRTLLALHERIHGHITDPVLNSSHFGNLGVCYFRLGDYQKAIGLHTQALDIARDIGNHLVEGNHLGNLGNCYSRLGNYQKAIGLHTQALDIARDIGDPQGEGAELGNLGNCYSSLGDYGKAIGLLTQALDIARDVGDRQAEGAELGNLGVCYSRLGDYGKAIGLLTQALDIARDIGDRQAEGAELANLGNCYSSLGDYGKAIGLLTQALDITHEIGDRYSEANALDYLGRAWLASGDAHRAVTLLKRAVSAADATSDIEPTAEARSWLARAQLQLGDPGAALTATTARPELRYPAEEPVMRLLEGLALLELNRAEEGVRAFGEALAAADALLALAECSVAALQARAVALSGLAVVTADPAWASEAVEAFAQARNTTTAAGVTAETRRLLYAMTCHDRSGILAGVSASQD